MTDVDEIKRLKQIKLPYFTPQVRNLPPSYLVSPVIGLLGGLLELGDDGVEALRLAPQALHLLTDRVHDGSLYR